MAWGIKSKSSIINSSNPACSFAAAYARRGFSHNDMPSLINQYFISSILQIDIKRSLAAIVDLPFLQPRRCLSKLGPLPSVCTVIPYFEARIIPAHHPERSSTRLHDSQLAELVPDIYLSFLSLGREPSGKASAMRASSFQQTWRSSYSTAYAAEGLPGTTMSSSKTFPPTICQKRFTQYSGPVPPSRASNPFGTAFGKNHRGVRPTHPSQPCPAQAFFPGALGMLPQASFGGDRCPFHRRFPATPIAPPASAIPPTHQSCPPATQWSSLRAPQSRGLMHH